MRELLTIDALNNLARRRTPKIFFDYAGSGSWPERMRTALGVKRALEIRPRELDITMALCGKRSIASVDRAILAGAAQQFARKKDEAA